LEGTGFGIDAGFDEGTQVRLGGTIGVGGEGGKVVLRLVDG